MKPYAHDPRDAAVANFKCALSANRLTSTPSAELALALSRSPRLSNSGLSSVYVIGNEANSLLKIGYADNLKSRFLGLDSGSPVKLSLLHFIHVVDGTIAKRIESETHRLLADSRRHGEWFEVTLAQAAQAIQDVVLSSRLRWWTEEESRSLAAFARNTIARHEERLRLFG